MSKFSKDLIYRIKDQVSIVDIVQQHIPLTKRGKNWIARCPFHNEKTPSFNVSDERKGFYCFGCHAKGNLFDFLMQFKNIDFPEAVQEAARFGNIPIVFEQNSTHEADQQRQKIASVNERALHYYQKSLKESKLAEAARSYLATREMDPATIEAFRIGFAPDQWDYIYASLTKERYKDETLLQADLIRRSNSNTYYDSFRNRIIFPIMDDQGRVAAFGGRVMDDSQPKYLNSTNHLLFNKGEMLFNLNQALPVIRESKQSILVEGYFDVAALWQAGIKNVVAPLGTALRINHLHRLSRYANEVILLFDGDEPGKKAAEESLVPLLQTSLQGYVVELPNGLDPCDFVLKHGRESLETLMSGKKDILDYKIQRTNLRFDLQSYIGRRHYLDHHYQYLSKIQDPIIRETYLGLISSSVGLLKEVIKRYYYKKEHHVKTAEMDLVRLKKDPKDKLLETEKFLLFSLLVNTKRCSNLLSQIEPELFHFPNTRKLYGLIVQQIDEIERIDLDEVSEKMDDPTFTKEMFQEIYGNTLKYSLEDDQSLDHVCARIKFEDVQMRKKELMEEIHGINQETDGEYYRLCLDEYQFLSNENQELKKLFTNYPYH